MLESIMATSGVANLHFTTHSGLSKLAVIAATKVWAREEVNIKVNACCPGYCVTDSKISRTRVRECPW